MPVLATAESGTCVLRPRSNTGASSYEIPLDAARLCFPGQDVHGALTAGQASAATFEGADVPVQVRTAMCDSSPRIIVEFAISSRNIWYPANAGDSSKYFFATAMAAKVAGQKMYFLGTDDTATSYCVTGGTGRLVQVFGINDG